MPSELRQAVEHTRQGRAVWLVGGAVRDALMGAVTDDFDFVIDRDAIGLARRVANTLQADYYTLDAERDIGRVLADLPAQPASTLDFSGMRAADILDDLRARDFSINALAVPLETDARILDPCGGAQDLRDKRLRACTPTSIADDPIRAVRLVRLACQLGFQIDPATAQQATQARQALRFQSPERVRDELFRILVQPRPAWPIRLLHHLDLFEALWPELVPLRGMSMPATTAPDALEHTLLALDALARLLSVLGRVHDEEAAADLTLATASLHLGRFREPLADHLDRELVPGRPLRAILALATLFHASGSAARPLADGGGSAPRAAQADAGAAQAAGWGLRNRLSSSEIHRLRAIVKHHGGPLTLGGPQDVRPRSVYRLFRQTGEAGVDAVLLSLAAFLAAHVPPPPQEEWETRLLVARAFLEGYFERRDEMVEPRPLVRGDEVARFLGVKPGPMIGKLLERLAESQVEGEIQTPEQALDLARSLMTEAERDSEDG